jgi:hypothetical protein
MLAQFSIGPSTNRISFVAPGSSYMLQSWRPNETGVEDQVSSSSMADYDRLVRYRYTTTEETFTIAVKGQCPDDVADRLGELRETIKAARDFWVDRFNNEPIYWEVKSTNETETRYCYVHSGKVPTDPPPFEQPYNAPKPLAWDTTVVIRRGPWLDQPPQTATSILLSAVEAYDGRNLGNVDSAGTREPVSYQYVANKHNVANLTHIFTWSAANGFSANLMDAALPYNLIDDVGAAPQANDYVCFGVETGAGSPSVADSGPFCSLVFDIQTALSGIGVVTWEYWNGVAWVGLDAIGHLEDNTNAAGAMTGIAFDTTGVGSVHWRQPAALAPWQTTTVNGVTAWWVRARVAAPIAAPVVPVQQNRDVYSIVWGYAEIAADQVGGDLPAYLRLLIEPMSDDAVADRDNMKAHETWIGLRDYARGADFTAFLNAADEQLPAGIRIIISDGDTSFQHDVSSATGRIVRYAHAFAGGPTLLFQWYLDQTIYPEYYGSYQCFLRARQDGGNPGDIRLRIGAQTWRETSLYLTRWREFEAADYFQILHMGRLQLPGGPFTDDDVARGSIFVYSDISAVGGATVDFYDLILIPTDEWIGYFTSKGILNYLVTYLGNDFTFDIDPIMNPKVPLRALLSRDISGDDVVYEAFRSDINASYPFLTPGNRQRIWMFSRKIRDDGPPMDRRSDPEYAVRVSAEIVQAYNTARGTR